MSATALRAPEAATDPDSEALDATFFALADPVRRAILERLDHGDLLVSEVAAPFAISLQAVSRHIQVLVRAGLVRQERSGRISRCRLEAGPIFAAALWLNRYSHYWQAQFDLLAQTLEDLSSPPTSQEENIACPTNIRSSPTRTGSRRARRS